MGEKESFGEMAARTSLDAAASEMAVVATTSAENAVSVSYTEDKKDSLGRLGVSVHWLQTGFMEEVNAFCCSTTNSGRPDLPSATVHDIEPWLREASKATTCPIDDRRGSSYAHALLLASDKQEESRATNVGPANYMLSYGWRYKVAEIVDTLVDFCDTTKGLDPTTTYVWICCLCNNQHRVKEMRAHGKVVPFEDFQEIFYRNVTGIKNILAMMAPWQDPIYLTRIWCIFELFTAHTEDQCHLTIVMPPKERADLAAQLQKEGSTGVMHALFQTLAATKVQGATARFESDRIAILQLVVKEANNAEEGYDTLNHKVNDLLRGWALSAVKSLAPPKDGKKIDTAMLYNNIGSVLTNQGDYEGALVQYRKSVTIREVELGKNHPDTATSYNNIGLVLYNQGNYGGALIEYRKALVIRENVLPKDWLDIAISYNNIGRAMSDQGDYEGALVEHRKSLAIREAMKAMDHPITAIFHNNTGMALSNQGNYKEALVELRKGLAIREAVLGKNLPDTANSYDHIGLVLSKQGHCEHALVEHRKALAIRETVKGKSHPDTAISYFNIGSVLYDQGHYEGALVEHRKALAIRKAVLRKDHPDTANSYDHIGLVLSKQGHYEHALVEHRKALAIGETAKGKNHPDTAISYYNIGSVLYAQGHYEGALVEHRKALAIRKVVLQKDHPDSIMSHNSTESILDKINTLG